jgi:hypothetical protein
LWAIHRRYCPGRYMCASLCHYYAPVLHDRYPRLGKVMATVTKPLRKLAHDWRSAS